MKSVKINGLFSWCIIQAKLVIVGMLGTEELAMSNNALENEGKRNNTMCAIILLWCP